MAMILRSSWINGAVALMLFMLVVVTTSGTRVRVFATQPTVVMETIVETPVLRATDRLSVRFVIDKNKLCKTDVDRFLMADDRTVIYRDRVTGGAALLGKTRTVRYVLALPPDIKPGKYFYRGFVHSDCDDGQYTTPQPDGPFEVVE